ncbi:Acg family FMN-binding oxidoreductase [Actinopolyspora mortivallis]|uniref:Nitroreductase domain-containing protein n=1 Tax=Actinopolyspora mortivallis TaxID=33906 RepID=A0A2T0GZM6_ACTMO|nr:nitroreductase family protein [Actinopolyspora mortivallis]PRW64565.1 hypothetical protein CEP50_04215 [Actinopolyspora mortivallis]
MSWLRPHRRRAGTTTGDRGWTADEVHTLEQAVGRAPSVHNTQPWSLVVREHTARLYERPTVALEQHDPEGRDRRLSCGAALTNLFLAVRGIGWEAELNRPTDSEEADLVGRVTGTQRRDPTVLEGQRFRAITRRSSYRRPFHDQGLAHVAREALLAAGSSSGVRARWLSGPDDARNLAELLGYAARVHRKDRHYQRELAMWMTGGSSVGGHASTREDELASEGVPAVGLTTSGTRLPDEQRLAEWIEREAVMVLSTESDARDDHLRTGEAMQLAWLTATSLGLAASVITQPLHLSEVRRGLAERLGLVGEPHILMRFGYPDPVPRQRG